MIPLSLFLSLSARFSVRLEGAVGARRLLERCGGGAVRLEAALDNDVIWMTHHIAQEIALLEALSLSDPPTIDMVEGSAAAVALGLAWPL